MGWTRVGSRANGWAGATACAMALGVAWIGAPGQAQACGGTFCDAGPQVMPVDQTGENVLFVMEDGVVEAHVQIQYTGDPEQFAWVVPVMAFPEVEVGSDPLFQSALTGTVPTFSLNTVRENCDDGPDEPAFGCAARDDFAAGGDGAGGYAEVEFDGSPDVKARDVVGSFEYVVLEGGTAQGVVDWLNDNGFAQDDEAPPILSEYHSEGFMFVAFKLRPGAGVEEIHPVVLRYEGSEPCVPIRLTRIAAQDDMGVRVFFLGDDRVVPTNYRHVRINPLKINWIGLGTNYEEVVSLAVDEEGADGHGFVTEYAGPSNIIDGSVVHSTAWSSAPFLDARPETLSLLIEQQGLLGRCGTFDDECLAPHPLALPLLTAHFPPPPGIDAEEFFACTECFYVPEPNDWNPTGFAAAFEEQIIGPGEHAQELLRTNPYLTRMYTTISPAEMTEDPLFHETSGLPSVSNQWTATRVNVCDGPDRLELADGTVVWFTDDDIPPTFEDMPMSIAAEEIMDGAPMVLVDRAAEIDGMLDDWNDGHAPDMGCGCSTPRPLRGSGTLAMLVLLGLRARRRR